MYQVKAWPNRDTTRRKVSDLRALAFTLVKIKINLHASHLGSGPAKHLDLVYAKPSHHTLYSHTTINYFSSLVQYSSLIFFRISLKKAVIITFKIPQERNTCMECNFKGSIKPIR